MPAFRRDLSSSAAGPLVGPRRRRWRAASLLAVASLLVGAVPAVEAATPPVGAPITAPDSGTVTRTWTGTAPGPSTGSLVFCICGVKFDLYRQIIIVLANKYVTRYGYPE